MWLSLILVGFLIATTYFQAIQGLTSALIMAVLSIVSAAIAFGCFEYVAETALMGVIPDFAHAVAFMGTFVIPLLILRVIMDSLVGRANLLPHMLDRVGAGVVGFFAAFLITGMVAITLQLVPWPTIIGYQRFDPRNPQEQKELLLRPDRAAASFGAALSGGVFGGANSFASVHPDFVSEIGWLQAGLLGVRRTAPVDALQFVGMSEVTDIFDAKGGRGNEPVRYEPVPPDSNHVFRRVAIQVNGSSETLGDSDGLIRYVPAAVRLVGDTDGKPEIYHAIAVPDEDSPNHFVRSFEHGGDPADVRYAAGLTMSLPTTSAIELIFETPRAFVPRLVRFKWGATAEVTGVKLADAEPPAPTAAPTPTPATGGGGRVSGVRFKSSHFGDDLPLTLTAYAGIETEVSNGVLEQGQLTGLVTEQGVSQANPPVSRFKVPEGKALLQLNVENLRAGSLLGKALNQAVQTVENYIVEDDRGGQHTPVGKYAIATVGGEENIELIYFPEYASSGGRLRSFDRIKSAHMVNNYQLVYLYLLDSGARAVKFSPGGNQRSEDLTGQNLVAP